MLPSLRITSIYCEIHIGLWIRFRDMDSELGVQIYYRAYVWIGVQKKYISAVISDIRQLLRLLCESRRRHLANEHRRKYQSMG